MAPGVDFVHCVLGGVPPTSPPDPFSLSCKYISGLSTKTYYNAVVETGLSVAYKQDYITHLSICNHNDDHIHIYIFELVVGMPNTFS